MISRRLHGKKVRVEPITIENFVIDTIMIINIMIIVIVIIMPQHPNPPQGFMQPNPHAHGQWPPMGLPSYNNPQPVSTVMCNILIVPLCII